jgi:MoxR-like ATPase
MLYKKFLEIETDLNSHFIEREEIARAIILAALAAQHVCFIGPPGTTKSLLCRRFVSLVDAPGFEWLLTNHSSPEELFGPHSIPLLEKGKYQRITTGKLPEAVFAFLDEIWNANTVLKTTLSVVNERIFHNDGAPMKCPLVSVFAASNVLPNEHERELLALWDRFLLRYVVDYIADDANFINLLKLQKIPPRPPIVSLPELHQSIEEVEKVSVPNIILEQVKDLRNQLRKEGIMASDRRWKESLGLIRANAWLDDRAEAEEGDLEILMHALWAEPEQFRTVQKVINTLVNPLNQKALEFLDMAAELHQQAMSGKDSAAALEANRGLKNLSKEIETLLQANPKSKTAKLTEVLSKITSFNKEVVTKCLGIEL